MKRGRSFRVLPAAAATRAGVAAACLLAAAAVLAAPPRAAPDHAVKAAFIYNLAQFVHWPAGDRPDEPFVVTVLGADPIGAALQDALRGRAVGRRPIVLRLAATMDEVGPTQILFISGSEESRLASILERLGADPVLTVGDMGAFAAHGGVVGFRLEGDRVRLEVSRAAAERSRLRLSSQLLRLARIVEPEGR